MSFTAKRYDGHAVESGNGWSVEYAPLLAEHTSMRLGGTAVARIRFSSPEAVEELADLHKRLGGILMPMGCGTNVIARGGELPLTLVSMERRNTVEIVADEGETVLVRATAGIRLPALQSFAAARGLSGLEGLCGIPGDLGGALAMNAGSFGAEMGDMLVSMAACTPEHGLREFAASDLNFGYRKLEFLTEPSWFFICSATLRLLKKTKAEVRALMAEAYGKKQAAQPLGAWSAGCVFKNPPEGPAAGKLLDDLGFKGKRLGRMEFSKKHANFLVNTGKGTPEEAYDLINLARETVAARTGAQLQLEVRLWP